MSKDPVFPNFNTKSDIAIGLASPRDRLAALILDITLLLPLVQFCQAPIKKWILESLLFYKGVSAPFYELVSLFVFGVLFILYFTLTNYFFGQSVGKLFFKIKVISYHGHLTLFSSFLRSLFILLEFALIGLPFLALYSHHLRRAMHDRVSDTLVISLENPVGFPQVTMWWKMCVTLGSVVGCLLLSAVLYYSVEDEVAVADQFLIFNQKVCDTQFDQVDDSISAMIELYLVQQLNSECLFSKAREALWKNENKSIAQLAMALAYEENKDQSDQYLESVCEPGSDERICVFSQWLLSERSKSNKNKLIEIVEIPMQENFIKIFAAAYFRKLGDYSKVEEILSRIQDKKQLEPLLAVLSFQSYLGQSKINEAIALYKTHSILNEENLTQFIRFEMINQNLSIHQQVQVLEKFYPQLLAEKQERNIASQDDIPVSVIELHAILRDAL